MTEGPCRRATWAAMGSPTDRADGPFCIDRVVALPLLLRTGRRRCFSHRARASAFGGYARLVDVKKVVQGKYTLTVRYYPATTAKANKRR